MELSFTIMYTAIAVFLLYFTVHFPPVNHVPFLVSDRAIDILTAGMACTGSHWCID